MDNKKKGQLILLIAAVVGVTLLFVILSLPKKGDKDVPKVEIENVTSDMPDPSVNSLPGNKLKALNSHENEKKRGIEAYWDEMAGEAGEEDPVADMNAGGKVDIAGGGKSGGIPSYEEIFKSKNEEKGPSPMERRAQREAENQAKLAAMMQEQNKILEKAVSQQAGQQKAAEEGKAQEEALAPEKPAERDKIDVNRVKVVRSGGISSLGSQYGSGDGSGVSSLGNSSEVLDVDDEYPFRCMFVKEEKLKSGQRVSVRLLEDIIVEGQLLRKDTHLNAVCTISDRIDLVVTSVDLGGRMVNLNFEAYDVDGTKGIYAPDLEDKNAVENALKKTASSTIRRRASSAVGQTAQDIIQAGLMVVQGTTGQDRTVMVPQGYQFYLVKKKRR